MTIARRLKQASLALLMLSSLATLQNAYAAGTLADTQISNQATVNYSVEGVPQTAIPSNVATFRVDRVVDVDVEGGITTTTVPGARRGTLFTVTNTGNGTDTFNLGSTTTVNVASGDDFDVTSIAYYLDDTVNGTLGQYDLEDDLITASLTLAPDVITNVFVVADTPLDRINDDDAIVRLTATSTSTATGAGVPDDPATVQVVIDTQSDNDTNTFTVETATLSVVKSSAVIEDPVNGPSANAKAIPGAIVEYTIIVTNNGSATATGITLTDTLQTPETAYVAGTLELNGSSAGTVTGSDISVPLPDLTSGATATVTFQIEIQ
jgi:uncharacterized repeat protein (TIGR01451 family)